MVESAVEHSFEAEPRLKNMAGKSEEQLLELINGFRAARRRGLLDVANELATELFPELCNRLKTFTRNLFRGMSDSDHEDIVQEVMFTVIKDNYAKLDKVVSLSYLYSICYSKGKDLRRTKAKVTELDAVVEGEFQIDLPAPPDQNPDVVDETARRMGVMRRICEKYVPGAVAELAQPYRDIANLLFIDFAYQDGKISNDTLFEMLYQKPVNAASAAELDALRQRKSRARKKLAEVILIKADDDPEAKDLVGEFAEGLSQTTN